MVPRIHPNRDWPHVTDARYKFVRPLYIVGFEKQGWEQHISVEGAKHYMANQSPSIRHGFHKAKGDSNHCPACKWVPSSNYPHICQTLRTTRLGRTLKLVADTCVSTGQSFRIIASFTYSLEITSPLLSSRLSKAVDSQHPHISPRPRIPSVSLKRDYIFNIRKPGIEVSSFGLLQNYGVYQSYAVTILSSGYYQVTQAAGLARTSYSRRSNNSSRPSDHLKS